YEEDDVKSLSERILKVEHQIYPEAIRLIAEGRVRREGRKVIIFRDS
ncbi:MAG: phosphoribosylglycinamide formyltransferase, partial [Peptococcaceae bacterium]|nr:phosphoribosylglycinamide formyltransferase [Peptococcaceae bacterium]